MTAEQLIKNLPTPTKPEEILIYNFLCGKQEFPVQAIKTKDLYMQALLVYLAEKFKALETTEPPKRTSKKTKE